MCPLMTVTIKGKKNKNISFILAHHRLEKTYVQKWCIRRCCSQFYMVIIGGISKPKINFVHCFHGPPSKIRQKRKMDKFQFLSRRCQISFNFHSFACWSKKCNWSAQSLIRGFCCLWRKGESNWLVGQQGHHIRHVSLFGINSFSFPNRNKAKSSRSFKYSSFFLLQEIAQDIVKLETLGHRAFESWKKDSSFNFKKNTVLHIQFITMKNAVHFCCFLDFRN